MKNVNLVKLTPLTGKILYHCVALTCFWAILYIVYKFETWKQSNFLEIRFKIAKRTAHQLIIYLLLSEKYFHWICTFENYLVSLKKMRKPHRLIHCLLSLHYVYILLKLQTSHIGSGLNTSFHIELGVKSIWKHLK